ncbi:MAG: TRAP transporter small permease [Alphaproteobacteria bacterium]|jgi:TRAP-type C4-dicarboxylate transport system permease small subunit|nr:TRAP transporter small permease [Alphaproteobacteria bacterium]
MDGFLVFSHRAKESIYSVLGWIASATLLILTLFALLEIIRRYVFGVVFEWGQDAIVVGMVSAVAFYFGVTQIRRSHLVMNAIVQLLQSRGYYKTVGIMRILVSAVILLFCGAISVTGWSTLSYAWDRDLMTYSLIIPLWPFYLILMFGFGLMAFIAALQMIEDIVSFVRGEYVDAEIELTTDV